MLADVPVPDLEAVTVEFEERAAEPGDLLVRQGSLDGGFCFLIEGQVAVETDAGEVTRIGPGEPFGEISALLGEPATGNVRALGPVRYLRLPRDRIKGFLTAHPALCFSMVQGEARRLRHPNRWYSSQTAGGPDVDWTPRSWRTRPVTQQPEWPDDRALQAATDTVRELPPLVFGGEADRLTWELGEVAAGRAFLLQAGDCAETFADLSTAAVKNRLQVILQMALVLTYGSGSHIVSVARMAGQFAKARTSPTETVDGVELPVYRGDIVNSAEPDAAGRVPDPARIVTAYHQAAAKLNLIRSLTNGGFGGLSQIQAWNRDFVAASPVGRRYRATAAEIENALRFMRASRIQVDPGAVDRVDVWTSHEALLLEYEEALTRRDDQAGTWYDTSAHMLWIGERNVRPRRSPRRVPVRRQQPPGVQARAHRHRGGGGGLVRPPQSESGARPAHADQSHGRGWNVAQRLPPLLAAVRDAGHPVVWACDPMHANTIVTSSGRKTRRFDDILVEVGAFFAACAAESVWPGGLHVELTSDDVTECLGGGESLDEQDLDLRDATTCDPRLNGRQSLDLAFRVAEMLRAAI